MIRVEVKLFARARDLAGASSLSLLLPPGATVDVLRSHLGNAYPALATFLPRCTLAVGGEFAQSDHPLTDGDEAAVLPPVSGG